LQPSRVVLALVALSAEVHELRLDRLDRLAGRTLPPVRRSGRAHARAKLLDPASYNDDFGVYSRDLRDEPLAVRLELR
jgi:hypothetical protein